MKIEIKSDTTVHSESNNQMIIEIILLEVRIDDLCITQPERVYAVRREDWCIGFVGCGGTYFNDDVIMWTQQTDTALALIEVGAHIDAELRKLSSLD